MSWKFSEMGMRDFSRNEGIREKERGVSTKIVPKCIYALNFNQNKFREAEFSQYSGNSKFLKNTKQGKMVGYFTGMRTNY